MINCKIGLISKPVTNSEEYFLNLGEIFDKGIRNNISILYELHKCLPYICSFNIKVKNDNIILDNMEDIISLQDRYRLTRKIWLYGYNMRRNTKKIKFLTPELYDISCMVPLFSDKIKHTLCPLGGIKDPLRIFILFPYKDPTVRGKIIDNCFNVAHNHKLYFYTMGGVYGSNKNSISKLNKRYLLSRGVKDEDIYVNEYDNDNENFDEYIIEALNMIDFIISNKEIFLYIGVETKDMSTVMNHIRKAKKSNKINRNIYLVCDY